MRCATCDTLMLDERMPTEHGAVAYRVWRCLVCGTVRDRVIADDIPLACRGVDTEAVWG